LLRIDDCSRRQLYAHEIQDLRFYQPFWRRRRPTNMDGLRGLRFARLRVVDASLEDHLLGAGAIAPFLQPRLVVLHCSARHLADEAVQQLLATQCQQLRELHLYDLRCSLAVEDSTSFQSGDHLSSAQPSAPRGALPSCCAYLHAALEALPAIEVLVLYPCLGACIADMYLRLSVKMHLKSLHNVSFNSATLRAAMLHVAQPFPALRELRAAVLTSDALPLLVAAVPKIESMALTLGQHGNRTYLFSTAASPSAANSTLSPSPPVQPTQPPPLFPPPKLSLLSTLGSLRKLLLQFPRRMAVARDDLVTLLLQLPAQLRELSAQCLEGGHYLRLEGFADADLAAVVARLPRLTTLCIGAGGSLSPRAFRIAGEACRELEELSLVGKCFLWALEGAHKRPLFPQLQVLESWEPQADRSFWEPEDWQ
jgi:hypothetical protein